jgi:hypothetical protein
LFSNVVNDECDAWYYREFLKPGPKVEDVEQEKP